MQTPEGCICLNGHNPNCPVHSTEEDQANMRAAFDRVFAMTPQELGQAALLSVQAETCPNCHPDSRCAAHTMPR